MKSAVFYTLLYLRPLSSIILKITGVLGILLVLGVILSFFFNGFMLKALVSLAIGLVLSFGSFMLRIKYTDVLLALQPEDKNYTFID